MYVYMHDCVHTVSMHVLPSVYMSIHMDVHMFVYMCAHMFTHVHLILCSSAKRSGKNEHTSALEHRSLVCAWETAQVTRQGSLLGLIE